MNAIIVDDEQANQENLHHLLRTYAVDVNICAVSESVDGALKVIIQYQPDLVFLDIQLHAQTGFDLLRQIRNVDFEIIFVTAYNQYGIEAIKFAALDYLLKPIDIDELQLAVGKARNAIHQKQKNERLHHLVDYLRGDPKSIKRMALPMLSETRYVNIPEIVRCQADNTYTHFYLNSGERLLVSKTLKEYADMLAEHKFIRTHQSHLVNASYIKSWLKEDGGTLLLNDGTKVPVSKLNRDKVKAALW